MFTCFFGSWIPRDILKFFLGGQKRALPWRLPQVLSQFSALFIHRAVSSSEEELVLRDLPRQLNARPISQPCVIIWHPLRAVPELHRDAIVSQAEPLAALGEHILY
eukprot:718331-Amphidinium_carterae.1